MNLERLNHKITLCKNRIKVLQKLNAPEKIIRAEKDLLRQFETQKKVLNN
jgi:peptidoglycan hydrolase CwlO-like protein